MISTTHGVSLLLLLYCVGSPLSAKSLKDDWPKVHLVLGEEPNFIEVLNSGLAVYRFPTMENISLGLKHVHLSITQHEGTRFPPFSAEYGKMHIRKDYTLSDMTLYGYDMTMAEARAFLKTWEPFARKAVNWSEVDALFAQAEVDGDQAFHQVPGVDIFSISLKSPKLKKQKPYEFQYLYSAYVGLLRSFDPHRPCRPTLGHSRHQQTSGDNFPPEIPIPLPPGWEHVSLEPPKNWGPDNRAERVRQEAPIVADAEAEDMVKTTNTPTTRRPSASREQQIPSPTAWWKWLLVFIALGLATWRAWKLSHTAK